jgi:C_GCAxxG_C_C family probable redox protein
MDEARKQALMNQAYERGMQNEARATDCCQSTIAAIQDTLGCRNDAILKAGSAFAGGVGFTHLGHCGALTGAVMVISQLCGRSGRAFDQDAKRAVNDPTFDYVRATQGWRYAYEMVERFIIAYGSPICHAVSSQVIGRIEGEAYIRPDSPAKALLRAKRRVGAHEMEGCPTVVGTAAKWATEIILRENLHKNDVG